MHSSGNLHIPRSIPENVIKDLDYYCYHNILDRSYLEATENKELMKSELTNNEFTYIYCKYWNEDSQIFRLEDIPLEEIVNNNFETDYDVIVSQLNTFEAEFNCDAMLVQFANDNSLHNLSVIVNGNRTFSSGRDDKLGIRCFRI